MMRTIPSVNGRHRYGTWWQALRLTAWLVLITGWGVMELGAQGTVPPSETTPAAPQPDAAPSEMAAQGEASNVASPPTDSLPEVSTSSPASGGLMGRFQHGGPMLIPIIGCSFVLLVFCFERLISLRRGRVIPSPFVKRFLHQLREGQLDAEEALELCDTNASPIAEVFAAAVKKWGRPATEVEQAVLDAGERVAQRLRKYLRLFNGIYTVTPLMGLLGTVVGMIHSFDTVATRDAMGRAELLAHGISEALISTAAGLLVAIPALLTYLFFVGRVDALIMEIDELGQHVVNGVAVDGWKEKKRTRAKPSPKAKAA